MKPKPNAFQQLVKAIQKEALDDRPDERRDGRTRPRHPRKAKTTATKPLQSRTCRAVRGGVDGAGRVSSLVAPAACHSGQRRRRHRRAVFLPVPALTAGAVSQLARRRVSPSRAARPSFGNGVVPSPPRGTPARRVSNDPRWVVLSAHSAQMPGSRVRSRRRAARPCNATSDRNARGRHRAYRERVAASAAKRSSDPKPKVACGPRDLPFGGRATMSGAKVQQACAQRVCRATKSCVTSNSVDSLVVSAAWFRGGGRGGEKIQESAHRRGAMRL